MKGGSGGVNFNGEDFKHEKGLRQGDPISPLLFNLVGDVLTRMLMKATRGGLVKGLLTNFKREVWSRYSMRMTPFCFLILRSRS